MGSITRNTGNYKITLNDVTGIITRSPRITQLFFEAAAHVVTQIAVGTISEVIVTIDAEIKQAQLSIYRNKIQFKIAKMEIATQEYFDAIDRAHRSGYPVEFVEMLEQALRAQLEEELLRLARSG